MDFIFVISTRAVDVSPLRMHRAFMHMRGDCGFGCGPAQLWLSRTTNKFMEEEKQNTHNFSAFIERQQTYKYVEKKAAKSICIFAASQIWSLRE